jgi:Na+-transporting NADH:ubiquinone oxidoreductase subunit F
VITQLVLGVFLFTAIVLALVVVILLARQRLVAGGEVQLLVNGERTVTCASGGKLLGALAGSDIFLSSACGGGGTCAQCKVQIREGGGAILPTELPHFTRREVRDGWRLSCQVGVKGDMAVEVPEEVFGVKRWDCTVASNHNVATFIKELVLDLPQGADVAFRAGGFMQFEAPAHTQPYRDFDIPERFAGDWQTYGLFDLVSEVPDETIRAYSMASYPDEKGVVKFNIRVATPPPRSSHPPGRMSSWLFGRKPGDTVTIFGPFGEFFPKETLDEKVYIGGGAGMAPLRSHIFDLLERQGSKAKISYWYGARSRREMFYVDDFDELARKHANFEWHVALSDPLPEDEWTGPVGFIHQVVLERYLSQHPAPEDLEYYLCGPPMMNQAVLAMLDDLGVDPERIALDDFGG